MRRGLGRGPHAAGAVPDRFTKIRAEARRRLRPLFWSRTDYAPSRCLLHFECLAAIMVAERTRVTTAFGLTRASPLRSERTLVSIPAVAKGSKNLVALSH